MKPCSFDYMRADTAAEAVECLAQFGDDARVLAGGQSLMPILNMRLAQPRLLLDISRTRELDYVRLQQTRLCIGAAATQASVEWRPTLAAEVPLLHSAFPNISHFQIRNRGTVCGSVAHADPSAELPLVLLALGGDVVLRSARGRRVVMAHDFFRGLLQTARGADEMIEEVRYPLARTGERHAFIEFTSRQGDFAIVAVAVVAGPGGIDVAVGGVADRPRLKRLPLARGAALEHALNDFAWELEAQDDAHASAKLRRHLVRCLGCRAIQQAIA